MGTAMFYLELHGTTDQRHILRGLRDLLNVRGILNVMLVLDDTGVSEVHLRLAA